MQFRNTALATTFMLLGAGSFGAHAAFENLLVDNSTLATAQAVGPFSNDGVINVFGLRGTIDVFGTLIVDNHNADYYSFDITGPRTITLRVDTPDGPFLGDDPVVGLFSPEGIQLINDDDGGPGFDSLLSFTVSASGTYFAAVSGFNDFDFDGVADSSGNASTDWPYTLQISAADPAPVPVPAAGWLLGSALLGLVARKRAKT